MMGLHLLIYTCRRAKRSMLTAIFFLAGLVSFCQTNISGVVNTYHPVVEVIPAKACVRLSDMTGITVNTRILLVQMKGATISTANNASFGDTITTGEAGFYEVGTICYIRDDSVFLFHQLLNTYSPASGQVQLVQFAEYTSANVVDTLKAAPWNETTGTGGVIALFADADITLNAPIYADSSGYRGGKAILSTGTCSNVIPASSYYYTAAFTSPQNGAYKGEGIVTIGTSQNGGRGALLNGGGGGNNHNNSGGGGANLSAGGAGGGNSSTAGCTATLRGLGGKPLQNWGGRKIFCGGGGGAGHNNNGTGTNGGGNGGGIIFIWANNLVGNSELISANGGTGGLSLSDGAGGGGSGGTIILNIANYTGPVSVLANGGNGGHSDDGGNIGRCFGGGGGGSGGAIYFSGLVPPIATSVAAGAAGVESGRDASCGAEQAAAAGAVGAVFSSYSFTRSTNTAGYCSLLLPSKLVYFNGNIHNEKALLSWQIQNPELVSDFIIEKKTGTTDWVALMTTPADNSREIYSATDAGIYPGDNFYRLRIRERSGMVYYSAVRRVFYDEGSAGFSFYP
ncbi:MAG: hypothetical protein JNM19_11835, partial [Chitinophagaceae bacterium]|nr:hypothetical protein [Chitinophagaceae bacterium]